jgi:hypothetical protein
MNGVSVFSGTSQNRERYTASVVVILRHAVKLAEDVVDEHPNNDILRASIEAPTSQVNLALGDL